MAAIRIVTLLIFLCFINYSMAIINGQSAAMHFYELSKSIVLIDNNLLVPVKSVPAYCSGVVISNWQVLTSAMCCHK